MPSFLEHISNNPNYSKYHIVELITTRWTNVFSGQSTAGALHSYITFNKHERKFTCHEPNAETRSAFVNELAKELDSKQIILIDSNRMKMFTQFSAQEDSYFSQLVKEIPREREGYSLETLDIDSTPLKILFEQSFAAVPLRDEVPTSSRAEDPIPGQVSPAFRDFYLSEFGNGSTPKYTVKKVFALWADVKAPAAKRS